MGFANYEIMMVNLPSKLNSLLDPGSELGVCYRFLKNPICGGYRYFFINMYRNDLLKFYAILSFLSLKRDERIWVVNFITKGMEEFMKEKGNEKRKIDLKTTILHVLY